MSSDKDRLQDFNEAYDIAQSYWAPYLVEAKNDLAVMLNDQWDAKTKKYLAKQRRAALVFNKVRRVVKLIGGYQRKNRLSMKIMPIEGADENTADQLSGIIQWQMSLMNGYNIMSDAFSAGTLHTGINLVNLYMDYSQDPVNGDIKIKRVPYNKFLLDPAFTERDLSDCGFICRREYLRKDAMLSIIPSDKRKEAAKIKAGGIQDLKYTSSPSLAAAAQKDLYRYDEFWRRKYDEVEILIDTENGKMVEWTGDDERLLYIMQSAPGRFQLLKTMKKSVEQIVIVEDIVIHHGEEPAGLDDYPFVPVMGFYEPEFDNAELKLQGIIRCMRDPQTEINKRRSKMLDIIDSQISSGWKAKENSVVNPESLYQSGQGTVVWMNGELADADRLQAPDVPPGMMQLSELFDRDIMEIPGANSELLGMPEAGDKIEVAGILAKLRQGQGLTILQDMFDNYRLSKTLLGRKLLIAIQKNYQPTKVMRILSEQPTQEFYNQDFGKYDCAPVEGVLSETQKQMSAAQLMAMKKEGAPIPWELIIDATPMENKKKLREALQKAEQQAQKQAQKQEQMADIQFAMAKAKVQEINAEQQRESTNARENVADAEYKRAKTAAEVGKMGTDRFLEVMRFIREISQPAAQPPQQGGPPQ